jgi:hypothetical protein
MRYALIVDQAEATMADYQKVLAEIGRDAPAGRLAHAVGSTDDGLRFIDIWESREDARRFQRDLLLPAFVKVFGDRRTSQPVVTELDVEDYIGAG